MRDSSRALLVDRMLPAGALSGSEDEVRRARGSIGLAWRGAAVAGISAGAYGALGSPQSGLALGLLTAVLIAVPWGIRRGVSTVAMSNAMTVLSAVGTAVVVWRTGGPESPALLWAFVHPLVMFSVGGRSETRVAGAVCGALLVGTYVAWAQAVVFPQDLPRAALGWFRVAALVSGVGAAARIVLDAEARRAESVHRLAHASRLEERDRLLADMHDGLGSQLLGLLVQVRAERGDGAAVTGQLEACLDELRLLISARDAETCSYAVALGELRMRLAPRCAAMGVELAWSVDPSALPEVNPERLLQVMRIIQEATNNALRHGKAKRLELSARAGAASGSLELAVRDDGVGFDEATIRPGRGLASMRGRALRMGAGLELSRSEGTTTVAVRVPPATKTA